MREILLAAIAITLVTLIFIPFLFKRRGPLYQIYKEAVQLENSKAYQEAIEFLFLTLSQKT